MTAKPSKFSAQRVLLAGKSNPTLAKRIAKELDLKLGKATVKQFSDGETYVKVEENVRDKNVYLIQSGSDPVDHNLMELLIMVHAVRNLQPRKIIAVIPFYPY